jgi:hypothetical protein
MCCFPAVASCQTRRSTAVCLISSVSSWCFGSHLHGKRSIDPFQFATAQIRVLPWREHDSEHELTRAACMEIVNNSMLTTQTGCTRPSTHCGKSFREPELKKVGDEAATARLAAAMLRERARLWDGVLRSSLPGRYLESVAGGVQSR